MPTEMMPAMPHGTPVIDVDLQRAEVDIMTPGGRDYRIEVIGERIRVWSPGGMELIVTPRSSNVVEALALTRAESRMLR